VKGDLQYFMSVTSVEEFIYEYQTDGREVIEQTLDIPLASKQKLLDELSAALYSSERYYTYKFIDRNCTTMVNEKIGGVLDGKKMEKVDDKTITYRELLYPYFEDYFWYKLGINIIFGAKTDAKAEQLFLPTELLHSLDQAKISGNSLVIRKNTLVAGTPKAEAEFSFFNSIYCIIAFLALLLLLNKRWLFLTYLFICGLLGLFLCLVGLYSEHQEVLWNYNALLFSPLFILLPFLKNNRLRKVSLVSIALLLVYTVVMINKPHLPIMLPFIVSTLYMLLKIIGVNPLRLLSPVK
jgi:hypothetical protein